MSILGQRIKELRKSKKVTQKELGAALSVWETAIQRYEYGTRIPELDRLIALADYFDVSLDYLVGRTDDPHRM